MEVTKNKKSKLFHSILNLQSESFGVKKNQLKTTIFY